VVAESDSSADGPLVALLGGIAALTAEALAWTFQQNGVRVMGPYASVHELQLAWPAGGAQIDAVVIDAHGPASGTAAAEIRRAHPAVKILLLCEVASREIVRCVLAEGIEGVVLKSDSAREMIVALRHVLGGRSVMPAGWQLAAVAADEDDAALASLSAREHEILDLAGAGMSNREIGARLVISPNTVKFHLRTIYARLGVRNRLQAARVTGRLREDAVEDAPASGDPAPARGGPSAGKSPAEHE